MIECVGVGWIIGNWIFGCLRGVLFGLMGDWMDG